MRFRLLHGVHNDGQRTYYAGDVIESPTDLAKRFNARGAVRFQPVPDDQPTQAEVVQQAAEQGARSERERLVKLEDMTVNELRQLAEEAEIDLGGARNKDQLVAAIKAARGE